MPNEDWISYRRSVLENIVRLEKQVVDIKEDIVKLREQNINQKWINRILVIGASGVGGFAGGFSVNTILKTLGLS